MKTIINRVLTLIFVLSLFSVPAVGVESQQSTLAITVSPSSQIVYQADAGKTFTLRVTNTSDKDVTLVVSERRIQREDGKNVPLEETPATSALEISAKELVVPAKSQIDFKVRVKLSIVLNGQFPAVYLQDKNTSSDSTTVIVNGGFYIPFIIEKENANVDIFGDLKINSISQFVIAPVLDVRGILTNAGDTFFDPAGTVTINRNNVQIYQQEVTSQVAGLMFPDETRNFNVDFIHDTNPLRAMGQYTVEAKFDATNANGASIIRVTYYYLPLNLILLGAGILLLLIVIILLTIRLRARRKTRKKTTKPA